MPGASGSWESPSLAQRFYEQLTWLIPFDTSGYQLLPESGRPFPRPPGLARLLGRAWPLQALGTRGSVDEEMLRWRERQGPQEVPEDAIGLVSRLVAQLAARQQQPAQPTAPEPPPDPDMAREQARGMSLRQRAGTVPWSQTPEARDIIGRMQNKPYMTDTTWWPHPVYTTPLENIPEVRRQKSTVTNMRQIEIPPDQGDPEDQYGDPQERQQGPLGPQPWMTKGRLLRGL